MTDGSILISSSIIFRVVERFKDALTHGFVPQYDGAKYSGHICPPQTVSNTQMKVMSLRGVPCLAL